MPLTLKVYLQRQTLLLVGIAYGVSLVILAISSLFQGNKSQDTALAGLVGTTGSQVSLLLPSFLLPEERAGQGLLLKRFQDEENLASASLLSPTTNSTPPEWAGSCGPVGAVQLCRRLFPSQVAVIAPISDGDRVLGQLLKVKDVDAGLFAKAFIPTAALLALALLLSLLGLIWMVMRLTSQEIPQAAEMLLNEVRRCLSDGPSVQPGSFRFEEFRRLSVAIDGLIRTAQDGRRMTAVARMTGMLAHDVRKPFSILRMGLAMLGNAKDPAAVKTVLAKIIPEIDKAVSSVDGLIADVMEIGSSSVQFIHEPASPESLIEATLGETFRIYPKADVAITYDLQHTRMTNVHVQKVGRIFSNIVGNAIQAMGQTGSIWFKTCDKDDQIEFCLGNAGSFIPAESLPKLFEAFFTSGKKGGTGLGLAIAEKIVKAHGGTIWCESSQTPEYPSGYVEFKFTLPAASGHACKTTANLPAHSSEITKALTLAHATATEGSVEQGELTLEEGIIKASGRRLRPLTILVVDDEVVYRSALTSYLARTTDLGRAITVVQAGSSSEAVAALAGNAFDLIITDVDMGPESMDGFELVQELRKLEVKAMIAVHSNRIVAADHRTAVQSGADAFLPKPIGRAQLLRLVLQAAQVNTNVAPEVAPIAVRQGDTAGGKPEVLIVEDNPFVSEAWEDVLRGEAVVHTMASLEDLHERLETDPGFATKLLLAVTDLHLEGSSGDGLDVGRLLKKHSAALRVLLCSDASIPAADLVGAIDQTIGKKPVGLAALNAL